MNDERNPLPMQEARVRLRAIYAIVGGYLLFVTVWIVATNLLVGRLAQGATAHTLLAYREWVLAALTGVFLLLLLVSRARSEQRMARARLQGEDRVRRILKSSMLGVAIWDENLKLVDANDALLAMLGYSRPELGGLDAAKLAPAHTRQFEDLRRATGYSSHEIELLRKDGTRVPALVGGAFQGSGLGEGVTFVLDLTVSRQTQASLDRARKQVDALLENAPIILWSTDKAGVFTYSSGRGLKSLGLSPGEVVGKSVFELFKQDDATAAIRRVLAGEGAQQVLTRSGEAWHQIRMLPLLDDGGRIEGMLGVSMDVTEQRQLEEQVRQAAKMEAVGRLAGGIAHDFNNLLTAIMGNTEVLQMRLAQDARANADLDKVMKSASRAADLTRQLLALGRKQVLQPRVFDLNGVVNDTVALLRRLLGEHIKIALHLAPDLGGVKADPGQLGQVVMNLAINARDAMPRGGTLTIETADVVLGAADAKPHAGVTPGPHVMLAVTDTGGGMDPTTLAHIFEPFFTTKEEGKGTGLGLSIVHSIVTQSGGCIMVFSKPGMGAAFKIYLPRAGAPAQPPPAAAAAPSRGGETLLLVEDDEDVRELLAECLRGHGYRVLQAADGVQARGVAEGNGDFQLLVTDVIMPGQSGPDLARELGKSRPGMKVLFISGYTFNAISSHGFAPEQLNLLEKPFSLDTLALKVREILDA